MWHARRVRYFLCQVHSLEQGLVARVGAVGVENGRFVEVIPGLPDQDYAFFIEPVLRFWLGRDVLIHAKEVGGVELSFHLLEPFVLAHPVSGTNAIGWLVPSQVVYVDSFLHERLNG